MSDDEYRDDTLIADLARAGVDPDLINRVANVLWTSADVRGRLKTFENIRSKWRENKRKSRSRSVDIPKNESLLVSKTLTRESIKKEVKQALQFPMSASDEAVAFAGSAEIGWLPDRIADQWQRFRDYNLTHGKRPKDLLAAWRSWCRSPYRSAPPPPQRQTKPLAPGQLPVAKEPIWMKPPPGCRTEAEIMASMYPKGKPNGK